MRFWLKNLYRSKQYGAWRLLSECPTRVGNLEVSTVCWRESVRRVQLSIVRQPSSGRPCSAHAAENLVLSQEDKPKRHRSAPFKCAQNNSPHSPSQMFQTTSCSAVVWSQSHLPSRALLNNLIVCNKSCYYSTINRKLSNKNK